LQFGDQQRGPDVNSLTTASGQQSNRQPGQTATFTTVAGGTGPFTILRKGATIVQADATSSYSIANAQASDQATYSITVTGLCNFVSNNFTLTVIIPPAISVQPQSVTRNFNSNATFR